MCRLFAAPPGMKKGDVLDILQDMEGHRNTDGFGYGFVKNGEFFLRKTHHSLSKVLKKKKHKDFFHGCFDHDGWVLFHLRAASVGAVEVKNAHPFVINNNILGVHNGTFKEAELVRSAFGKEIQLHSDTDSEVALQLLNKVGPKKFSNLVDFAGVFLVLEKNGGLWAIKTSSSGDLKMGLLDEKKGEESPIFLSSELPFSTNFSNEEVEEGWVYFDSKGHYNKHFEKDSTVNPRKRDWERETKKKLDIFKGRLSDIARGPARADKHPAWLFAHCD